jgi:hypothetical protein
MENKYCNACQEHQKRPNKHCTVPNVKKGTGLNIFHNFGLMVLKIKIKTI